MESGRIANEQISASSTYSDGRWRPQQSRLHGDDNGWTPNLDSNKEYLQVPTQTSESMQGVCMCWWVGAGGYGSSSQVNKGHEENKHNICETSVRSSIQTDTCVRHCAGCWDEMMNKRGTPPARVKIPSLGEVVWPGCCLPFHSRHPRNSL